MTTVAKSATKAEIIRAIKTKTDRIPAKFQHQVKQSFLNGLKYKTKAELMRIQRRIKVEWDKTGYDITF